mmetsp:Transcript_49578/g.141660  ORF Transcript_49578/g.141660 Transcript_49578/m.141660 type:complete len:202 (-) Transcript_49578:399-1004(-)
MSANPACREGADSFRPHVKQHVRLEILDGRMRHASRQDVHEPVCRILALRHLEPQALEVRLRPLGRPEEDGPAPWPQKKYIVEEREELVPRLVDHHDNCHVELCHLPEGVDDLQRRGGVQPRRGLVQVDQGRARDQLQADAHALALPTADAPLLHAPHQTRLDVADLKNLESIVDDVIDGCRGGVARVAQLGGEVEILAHR